MSSRRRKDIMEIIRQKSSVSQKVSVKDKDYALYAGGNPEIGFRMAKLDVFLESGFIPPQIKPFIKLQRALLDRQRKAWLACTGSEITVLGFLLGFKRDRISAVEEESKD